MIERGDHVRVTNGLKETILGRFDGVDYEFRPGDPVDIHHVVARHIFGFGLENKAAALARLGWATSSDQIPVAMKKLQLIRFTESPPLIEAPVVELVSPSVGERMPDRTSSASPLAGGGNAGAGDATAPVEPQRAGKPRA